MKKYFYSENVTGQTKQLTLIEAGFSLSNKQAYYIEGCDTLVYLSNTTLQTNLKTGLMKLIN